MKISLNILLDRIPDLEFETQMKLPSDREFRDVRLLSDLSGDLSNEILYAAPLSRVLEADLQKRGSVIFLCTEDTKVRCSGSDRKLKNLIIVKNPARLEELFRAAQEIFYQIGTWYQEALEAIISNRTFQEIIDLSEGIVRNYVQITDSSFKLLGYTRHIDCDEEITVLARKYGFHPESTIKKFEKHRRFKVWEETQDLLINENCDFAKYPLVSKIYRFSNTYFAHAVMVCNHVPLTQGAIDIFRLFMDVIGVYVEKDWERTCDYHNVYDAFLKDLYAGTLTRRDTIAERSRHVGIPAEGCFCLSVTSADEGSHQSPGVIAKELSYIRPDDKIIVLDGRIMILSLFQSKKARTQSETLMLDLEPVMEKYDLRCGVSDVFYELSEVQKAQKQAFHALSCSGRTPGASLLSGGSASNGLEKRVVSFNESYCYILLGSAPANQDVWRSSVYYRVLKMLNDYDIQHGMNNLQLLLVYLNCESRPADAGTVLHMSRNNVAYRVERIEQMIGMDLKQPEVRAGLLISYILLQLYGFE